MSILLNKETSILVQGITGSEGLFHAQQMLDYGSNVVCGVTPGKGGQTATENNLPVFNSIEEELSSALLTFFISRTGIPSDIQTIKPIF